MLICLMIMNNNIKLLKEEISIQTSRQFLYEITNEIITWIKKEKLVQGH